MVEDDVRREKEQAETNIPDWSGVLTDEDNDEEEYEAWKLRELKRIKRDRDERETFVHFQYLSLRLESKIYFCRFLSCQFVFR